MPGDQLPNGFFVTAVNVDEGRTEVRDRDFEPVKMSRADFERLVEIHLLRTDIVPAPVQPINLRPARARSVRSKRVSRRASKNLAQSTDGPTSQAEPPRPRAGQPVGAAVCISDANAFALVGLNPRQFRRVVRERGLPSSKVGRRTLVRADALLAALGLSDVPATETAKPAVDWRARATLRLVGGNRGAR